jgi:bifunctional UDP-N-acetylglucosamine pyrophosphorylase/glucosamine-1-phosphate N-acetyltransferase
MDRKTAIWFLPDGIALSRETRPLMLRDVMFCPVLTWTCEELAALGVERLFVVSDKMAHDLIRPLVPADAVLVDGANHARELLARLDGAEGEVIVLNGVVLPVGVFSGGAVYAAGASAVCDVLREHGAFAAFPKGAEILKGFLPVGDAEELRAALPMCRQKIVQRHFDAGVEILDLNNTYIDPRVRIGAGTTLLPGAILRGNTVIGENCVIGPNAMLTDCTVGDGATVNASQIDGVTVEPGARIGPFANLR